MTSPLGRTIQYQPELTNRQLDVLAFISNYRHANGYAPTMQEIADDLEISKISVFEHIGNLEKKGAIRREKHKTRSLEIVSPEAMEGPEALPLLGEITGNGPVKPIEFRENLDLSTIFCARNGVYVLRVRDESFTDWHIADSDFVVIERRETAQNGEMVIAEIDSEFILMARFYGHGIEVRLQPNHPAIEPRILDRKRVRIDGIVIGIIRGGRA